MKLKDRVSSAVEERPPELVFFGQWILRCEEPSPGARLNGCPAEDGDVLVPDPVGRWSLVGCDDALVSGGRFFSDALLGEQDADALLQLGDLLRSPAKARGGWLEWALTSPLAPGLDKTVKEHPLEEKIEGELHHLEVVCLKPRTHIRLETERVLVSRARRVDPRAPVWLAAHTEDWEQRRISGVQPTRVLAQVREEEWNLYENRVAARLIDNLASWLRRRIAEVRRVLNDVFVRLAEYQVSTHGSRHRLKRIFDLWGEAWEVSQGRDAAEHTLRRLERLLYRVLKLMDSPLYREVPRAAQVPLALRTTNLFANDANYRAVARLWHDWCALAAPNAPSPNELYRRRQSIQRGFDAWCMLVIVRACSQMGFFPVDEDVEAPIRPGSAVRLTSGHRLQWLTDGAVIIADAGITRVRFVPLAHPIELAQDVSIVEARTSELARAAERNSDWTVILHPAVPGPAKHVGLAGVGNPPFPQGEGAIDFVRVSPFSLESVERVARAVRWATLAPRMLTYPPSVTMPPAHLGEGVDGWLHRTPPNSWTLIRPPRPDERGRLALDRVNAEARSRRDRLALERQTVDEQLRRVRGDRRQMADLNRRKRDLLGKLQGAEESLRRVEEFSAALVRAEGDLFALTICPVCRGAAEFTPRANRCFAARCVSDSCGAIWELRHDSETSGRVPVLLPGGIKPAAWPRVAPPQWVDEVLGCDVLAVPLIATDGSVAFRTPRTTA